jgi:hypothetical protein
VRRDDGGQEQQKCEPERTIDERFVRPMRFGGIQWSYIDVNDESAAVERILNDVKIAPGDAVIIRHALIQDNRGQARDERRKNEDEDFISQKIHWA